MSDIAVLESRLAAALDRIRKRVEAMDNDTGTGAGTDLSAQLDEERTANAQLEERVKALKDRQDTAIAPLETRVATQAEQIAELDAELQKLRASNADLRELSAQLRSAATDGVAEAELINRALAAEVEALQAQRSADVTEIGAILSELKPLVEEA